MKEQNKCECCNGKGYHSGQDGCIEYEGDCVKCDGSGIIDEEDLK